MICASERGVSIITNADAHTSAAISRLNWRIRRFKWTPPFSFSFISHSIDLIQRKTKSGFCACAITFQTEFACARQQQTACYRGNFRVFSATTKHHGLNLGTDDLLRWPPYLALIYDIWPHAWSSSPHVVVGCTCDYHWPLNGYM